MGHSAALEEHDVAEGLLLAEAILWMEPRLQFDTYDIIMHKEFKKGIARVRSKYSWCKIFVVQEESCTHRYTNDAKKIRRTKFCGDPSWLKRKIMAANLMIRPKSSWNANWTLLTARCLWTPCCCTASCPSSLLAAPALCLLKGTNEMK